LISQLIKPEIIELFQNRKFSDLKEILIDWSPADIADLILSLEDNEQVLLFRLLPKELAADVFEYLDYDTQTSFIRMMSKESISEILNEMSPDDRTALFEEMPSNVVRQMIAHLSVEEKKITLQLLGYPENSVGRLMTPDYIAVKEDWTVQQTLEHIRKYGKDSETLNIIYVVNQKGLLIDDIKIRDILLSPLDTKIADLMDGNYAYLSVNDDQEVAIEVFKKYDRVALPVIDGAGVLIGIVTIDDILDIAEEEATEDIHKSAAIQALEDSYSSTSVFQMIKKRAGWLSILFVSEMFTATAMGFFEHEISKAIVLALFVPLIISSGGNSGSQASTLIIRALALSELKLKDWFYVFRRELFSGLILGIILAAIGFLRIFVWQETANTYGGSWFLVALTVCFSLVGVVTWGSLMGSMLPFILKKCGFDPATSSAPFVATLVDVTGIIIYFTAANFILLGKTF
jgi:magnesium transporter